MSIDPLSTDSYRQLLREQQVGRPLSGRQSREFAQKLTQVRAAEVSPEALREQAEKMLELTRQQLWDGLFGSDEEILTADFLAALSVSARPSLPAKQQQVEQVYRQLKPVLHPESTVRRSDIEQLIDRVAEKVSLAPELIRSVVAAESAFQPRAISPAGAQGLMQLMPATAKELGVADSYDPEQNLLGGSTYLKQLLEKYQGDLDKALAAYNWGPGNVDRRGLAEMPEETRNYLARVKGLLEQSA